MDDDELQTPIGYECLNTSLTYPDCEPDAPGHEQLPETGIDPLLAVILAIFAMIAGAAGAVRAHRHQSPAPVDLVPPANTPTGAGLS